MIYLDDGAITFHKPKTVIQVVADAMRHMGNSGRGSHETSLGAARITYDTRVLVSDLSGLGNPCQAALAANSTTSLNMAIQGLSSPGDHVITTMMEHSPVLRPLYIMRERGVELTIVRADGRESIRYEDLERATRSNTRGIICTHASSPTGNVVNIERVGRTCTEASLLFVLDVFQTAGVSDIHMEYMDTSVLCFTGHRSLMRPQGTGGIYPREGAAVRSLMAGGSRTHSYQEFRPGRMPEALETGMVNGHGIAGLHAALESVRSTGMETIHCRELTFMKRFYEGVLGILGVIVYGDLSGTDRHASVVALDIGNYDFGEVLDELAANYGIYTRVGVHCTSLMHQALGTTGQGAIRFSMSYYSTEEGIDQAIQAVRELVV